MRDKIVSFLFSIIRRLIVGREKRKAKAIMNQAIQHRDKSIGQGTIIKFIINVDDGVFEFMTDNIYGDFVHLYLESMESNGFITKEELMDAEVDYQVFKLGVIEESDRND